jgi:hypothetical protein
MLGKAGKLGSRPMTRFDGAQPVDEIRLLERIAAYLAMSPEAAIARYFRGSL